MANNTSLDHCSRCRRPASIEVLAAWPHICARCRRRTALTPAERAVQERMQRNIDKVKEINARRLTHNPTQELDYIVEMADVFHADR